MAAVSLPGHIVPLGDQVVEGAAVDLPLQRHARLTEGYAAVHAPAALLLPLLLGEGKVEFVKVADALPRRPGGILPAGIVHKSSGFSHDSPSFSASWNRRLRSRPRRAPCPWPPWRRSAGAFCGSPWR